MENSTQITQLWLIEWGDSKAAKRTLLLPSWRVFHQPTQIIWNGWFWFFMIFKHQKSFIQFGIILRVSCFIHRTQKFHVLARYIRIIRLCEFKKYYTLNSASVCQIRQMSAKNRKTWRWQNTRKCVVAIAVGFMAPLGNHWKMNNCKRSPIAIS